MANLLKDGAETLTLTQLYAMNLDHHDHKYWPYWEAVQTKLRRLAKMVVMQNVHDLFGAPLEDRIEDVYYRLLQKFIKRKFNHSGASIEPMLCHAARNDLMSSFRCSRSPTTATFDGDENAHEDDLQQSSPEDYFQEIRGRLEPFRFPEHPHIREAMLAYALTHHDYPGPAFLHSLGVHHSNRVAAYNAAVCDINRAIQRTGFALDEHAA